MKSELQRIKIAEARGWKVLSMREAVSAGLYHPTKEQDQDAWQFLYAPDGTKMASTDFKNKRWGSWVNMLPNYLNDLNAAIQLCDVLAGEGWGWEMRQARDKAWRCILHKRVSSENVLFSRVHTSDELEHPAPTLAEAICGAFLRVKGLWTEDTATV